MEKVLEFRNTNFAYNGTNAFNDFNLEIETGEIVTMIGTSGSGKSTLLKMLCHKLPNASVYYKGLKIGSYDIETLKREIVVVFDSKIVNTSLKEEVLMYLKKLSFDAKEIEERYKEVEALFSLDTFIKKDIVRLSKEQEMLIKLLRYMIICPNILAIDNLISCLSPRIKKRVFAYVKKHHITLLNVTTNLEDALYGNRLCVLDNFVLILEGNTLSVLKTDTLLKRLGFKLPMTVELSIELNHYDVLKTIYTDKDKLVGALWK